VAASLLYEQFSKPLQWDLLLVVRIRFKVLYYLTLAVRREFVRCQFGQFCKLLLGAVGRKIVEQVTFCRLLWLDCFCRLA
jgi:hypothetical protein